MTPAHAEPLPAAPDPVGEASGGHLGARILLAGLLALLLGYSVSRIDGYQLADSVEYVERAMVFAQGRELVDSQSIRSFGFSGLFLPIIAVGQWIGVDDWRWLMPVVRGLQMAFAFGLVFATVRLGTRIAGARAGWAAGVLLAANPAFLVWSVSPVSGVAAALCVVLGLLYLRERGSTRQAWVGGLWLGGGFLMAYQTILVIAPLLIVIALREGRSGRGYTLRVFGGVAICVLFQCILDAFYYGTFGISVLTYVFENSITNIAERLYKLGFHEIGHRLYNMAEAEQANRAYQDQVREGANVILKQREDGWYFRHLHLALTLPVLALALIGFLRGIVRRGWVQVLMISILVANIIVLDAKGSKSFRLWLPIFPLIAIYGGLGWEALVGVGPRARFAGPRRALGHLVLLGALVLGVLELQEINTRRFGGFWTSMDVVNRMAEPNAHEYDLPHLTPLAGPNEPLRVSCAYHWAVFQREAPGIELVKMPWQVDRWAKLEEEQRSDDVAKLDTLDVFIAHVAVLFENPGLFEAVNARFEVVTVLFDRPTYAGFGPIAILRRRTGDPRAKVFWDLNPAGPEEQARLHDLDDPGLRFLRHHPDAPTESLELLGVRIDPLPMGDGAWLSYHWFGGPFDGTDFTIIDRVSTPDLRNVWHNDHQPAYGNHPTSKWQAGTVLEEGYFMVAEREPYRASGPDLPLGGDYRRGDLVPSRLEVKIVDLDPNDPAIERSRLVPFPPEGPLAIEQKIPPGGFMTAQGLQITHDLMAVVKRFLHPVPSRFRWPDDGSAVPAEDPVRDPWTRIRKRVLERAPLRGTP